MKGFILAAGFGKRFLPVTESLPKPMFPIGGCPLIVCAISFLKKHGIVDIVINLHHLGHSIEKYLGDGTEFGVNLSYSFEDEILGTGGALKKQSNFLRDETFVVMNSDILFDFDLQAAIDSHKASSALGTMVLRCPARDADYGKIEIDEESRIRRILGTGESESTLRAMHFTGCQILEPEFMEFIPPDVETCIVRYAYKKALADGKTLCGFELEGGWYDAGTPPLYWSVNRAVLARELTLSYLDLLEDYSLSPSKQVADVIRLGEDVDLGPDSRLIPPVLVGNSVKIGKDAVVGPYAILQNGVSVGAQGRVESSVLLHDTKIPHGLSVYQRLVGRKEELDLSE
ncbi:MAG: NDP-sugar synthase [Myxococcota bacterium]|nr:NDP-sugar synthase [Myxococcota bacterium]